MKNILASIAILIGLIAPRAVNAECMACWNLKGVVVELSGGKVLEGYVTWNDGWHDTYNERFPDSLLSRRGKIQHVWFYRHDALRMIRYPQKQLVTLKEGVPIEMSSIKDIRLKARKHDGYEGAGSIYFMSEKDAASLMKPPLASCKGEGDVSVEYWLSYDKSVGKTKISCLCHPEECSETEVQRLRKNPGLIRISFAYD